MPANTYDPEADAAYVHLGGAAVKDSEEVAPGVVLDFDADGRVVGVELLNASKNLAAGHWSRWPLADRDAHSHAAE